MTRFVCILLLFCASIPVANAQFFTYGQDPASQKWRQIRTDNFRLIYPETWEDQAQGLAHFMEAIREPMSASLKSNPKPIPVILRNQTMLSNGFVMWAPKRVEMVTTIPYDNQAVDWMKYLAIHEYRHVVQVEAVNRSTTGFFSSIFGENITGSVTGLHLPLWFLEGDAVLAETSFTQSGRGRLPSFIMPLKAQLLEQGAYNYDKAMFGSYRDLVPDHYTMGYHLVASIQSKFGFEPFRAATKKVGATPFLPGSFSRGIKKVTGKNMAVNYSAVMTELQQKWESYTESSTTSVYARIESQHKYDYVSYINPQYIDDDTFIAFRTTPDDITRLVKIGRDGSEEILFTPGFGYYISMSYANGLAAWLEINRDSRWGYRNWTNIRIFDLQTGKSRLITHKARLQAPMLSPDGSKIVAVEVDETNRWALVIFETRDGTEIHRITDPEIDFIMEPEWSDCHKAIIAVAFVEGKGKSIVKTHIENPQFEHLFHAGFVEISEPAIHDCVIYFTGTWSGRDELYAWDIDEKQLFRVLASRFGATCASFSDDGSKILFSDYTSQGYQIAEYKINGLTPVNSEEIQNPSVSLYERAAYESNILFDTLSMPETPFKSEKFVKAHNSLNFHSWFPFSLDVDGMNVNPGITAFSQDWLGTTVVAAGYEYNQAMAGHKGFVDLSLRALYPVINFRLEAGTEDRFYGTEGGGSVKLNTAFAKAVAGMSLPLSFNRNSVIYGLSPRISTSQELFSFNYDAKKYDRGLRSVSYGFSAYAYQRMAYRDLYPKYGISVGTGFNHSPFRTRKPFTDLNAGQLLYGAAAIYAPGFFRHHSLRLYAGSQQKIRKNTSFSDGIRLARGYHSVSNDKMTTLSAAYTLPLWYPDIALGPVLYAKRLKANFFYDYSHIENRGNDITLSSYGLDILVDAHLLRMPMPFEFGLRTMYLDYHNELRFEFLWGVDFYAVGQYLKSRNLLLLPAFR